MHAPALAPNAKPAEPTLFTNDTGVKASAPHLKPGWNQPLTLDQFLSGES
jgi:hypothetical protein